LLDEPTNHLDPASVDVLTDALVDFPGTLVFISHDPVFLTRVATRVVEIETGQARDYHGDYEYFLWKKAQEIESIKGIPEQPAQPTAHERSAASSKSEKGAKGKGGLRRDLSKTLTRTDRQITRLEEEIAQAEVRIQRRDQELAERDLYQDHVRWNALNTERVAWVAEQAARTTQWASLCEETEKLRLRLKELERLPSATAT